MADMSDLYQEMIIDHSRHPRNRKAIDNPDRELEGHNPLCGDHIKLYLKLKDDVVEEVGFEGSGCAISTASASLMTEALKGKTLSEAKRIFREFHTMVTEGREVDDQSSLGKLEVFSGVCKYPARVKCATLAWHTLDAALNNQDDPVSTE